MEIPDLNLGDVVRVRAFITSEKVFLLNPVLPPGAEMYLDPCVTRAEVLEPLDSRRVLYRWPEFRDLELAPTYVVIGTRQFRVGLVKRQEYEDSGSFVIRGTKQVVCLKQGTHWHERERYAAIEDLELVKPAFLEQLDHTLKRMADVRAAYERLYSSDWAEDVAGEWVNGLSEEE